MSRYGSKTYNRQDCKSTASIQFDQLLSENTNKPSTAKVSVAGVHRWGMATFTSIRKSQLNGRREGGGGVLADDDDCNKRMKMNVKVDPISDPFSFDCDKDSSLGKPSFLPPSSSVSKPPPANSNLKTNLPSKPNKFFKSGGTRPLAQQNATRNTKSSSLPAVPSKLAGSATTGTASKKQLSIDSFTVKSYKSHEVELATNNTTVIANATPLPRPPPPKVITSTKDLFDMLIGDISPEKTPPVASGSVQTNYGYSNVSSAQDFFSTLPTSRVGDVISQPSTAEILDFHISNEPVKNVADNFFASKPPLIEKREDNGNSFSVENIMKMPWSTAPAVVSSTNPFHDYGHVPPATTGSAVDTNTNAPYRTYGRNKSKPVQPVSHFAGEMEELTTIPQQINNNYPSALDPVVYTSASSGLPDSQLTIDSSPPSSQPTYDAYSSSQVSVPDNLLTSSQEPDLPLSQFSQPSTSDSCYFGSQSECAATDLSQEMKEDFQLDSAVSDKQRKDHKVRSRKIFNTPKKLRAVYKVRAWHEEDKEESEMGSQDSEPLSLADEFEDEPTLPDEKFTLSKRVSKTTYPGESITSWKCERDVKQLYTVVHNVKQAHQCHESGETQEFNDDVEYLLEGVQLKSSLGTRCLSTLGWASKCMMPAFRIHLRAHGTIPRVFSALMDAPANPSLSLCAATLMFVLSQDRLTMDMEASTLSLMLQLLECNVGDVVNVIPPEEALQAISPHQEEKIREKVQSLCKQMQLKGYARQLDLNNITGGILAMETLLSLSSRKTGEWFKEEIRTLGGLDYIVDTVKLDADQWLSEVSIQHVTSAVLDKLRKIDRCLRVIENVTYMDSVNQGHLIGYKKAVLVTSCLSLLNVCRLCISNHPIHQEGEVKLLKKSNDNPGAVLFTCVLTLLKVLFNLSHENPRGSMSLGSHEGVIDCILLLLMQTPVSVPLEERFDLLVLSLALLINLVEHCEENRARMISVRTVGSYDSENSGEEVSGVEALVDVFMNRLELAKQSEEQADALLDSQSQGEGGSSQRTTGDATVPNLPSQSQQSQAEQMEETLMKALQKAGKHMEHSIIAAYIALLLGCVIQNPDYASMIKYYLPNENFDAMIEILRKFLNFVNLTGVVSTAGMKSVKKVLAILEAS